ncbi:hypothetical protein CHS0354_026774 [Potamilus streckersoni]|uniref:NusG-like N-terminal domain-containing protein n=1 Tax=Potamilus streckersoni TaxID=2493646 RepID=A0AAE0T5Z8_9BIVA|nr:hypothetical protein CHS0354_026774 [Potamilus streckersoni]
MEDTHVNPLSATDIQDTGEKSWYILKATAGSEKKVAAMLMQRIKYHNLEHCVEEVFIPAEEVVVKKQGKQSKRTITYYPGYIIIKIQMTDDVWHIIKETPKISGFVGGTQKEPQKISPSELQAIKEQINQGVKQAELNSTYQLGQSVRIIEGPFADFNGNVDAVDTERNKLTVKVSIFGRATPIELDFDKIPAGKANPSPPIGPALGQKGVNIMEFCKQFNAKTQNMDGVVTPVVITVFEDKSFTFILKTPPVPVLIKDKLKLQKVQQNRTKPKSAKLPKSRLQKLPKLKCRI